MGRLIERTVQNITLDYLSDYYKSKSRNGKQFARIEVRTNKGKRADGLIAFKRWLWGTFVISIEAKSHKTLPAMKPYRDNSKWFKNSVWAGVLGTALGPIYALLKMSDGLWQFMIPLYAFVGVALAYAIITRKSYRHQTVDVVNQVKQYPGNVQWLAFSSDSYNDISEEKKEYLKKICKYEGIGIIVVNARKKCEIIKKPKAKLKLWRFWESNLTYYAIAEEIRATI